MSLLKNNFLSVLDSPIILHTIYAKTPLTDEATCRKFKLYALNKEWL